MADFTPNYNLKKPLRTEYYNVADANGNSDIVDTQLKAVNDRVDLVESEVDALELGKVDKVVGKQLSDENYTLIEKNKVANLPDDTNAQLAEIEQDKAEKTDIGLLSGLLTTTKTSIVNAINELFNGKANKTQQSLVTPTLLNSTTMLSATGGYWKDEFGIVHLSGRYQATGLGVVMFTLPVGYRPKPTGQTAKLPVIANNAFGLIRADNGGLYLAIGNPAEIVLDGISFRAEG